MVCSHDQERIFPWQCDVYAKKESRVDCFSACLFFFLAISRISFKCRTWILSTFWHSSHCKALSIAAMASCNFGGGGGRSSSSSILSISVACSFAETLRTLVTISSFARHSYVRQLSSICIHSCLSSITIFLNNSLQCSTSVSASILLDATSRSDSFPSLENAPANLWTSVPTFLNCLHSDWIPSFLCQVGHWAEGQSFYTLSEAGLLPDDRHDEIFSIVHFKSGSFALIQWLDHWCGIFRQITYFISCLSTYQDICWWMCWTTAKQ